MLSGVSCGLDDGLGDQLEAHNPFSSMWVTVTRKRTQLPSCHFARPRYGRITRRRCNFGRAFNPVPASVRIVAQLSHWRLYNEIDCRMRNHDLHSTSGRRTKLEECRMVLIDPCNSGDPRQQSVQTLDSTGSCHRLRVQSTWDRFPLGFPFAASGRASSCAPLAYLAAQSRATGINCIPSSDVFSRGRPILQPESITSASSASSAPCCRQYYMYGVVECRGMHDETDQI